MTPKEKAEELIRRFSIASNACFTKEKQLVEDAKVKACALICVDEIMKVNSEDLTYWYLVKKSIKEEEI